MSKNSLAHKYIKNQSIPSWIDDPFDLKGAFSCQGVTMISYEQQLRYYTHELVALRAKYESEEYYLDLSMLDDEEKTELARIYIETTDREINECIFGDDFTINSDFTCALLTLLKSDTQENRDHFAYITRKNILTYYQDQLNETLHTACHDYMSAQMNEQGFYAHQDMETGEYRWSK